ncbi:hypothetical protein DQQ10_07935 [Pseudochryseolinea flava]|uniref:Uncharacterized protein n=1 Tax=Pseudochryseolinea flava TaxID=2059302 RepID=A0A364Y3Q0_9BACT|nr:hypothetical protein DQQ10_07935 [Pseudochryseolinea flava]
MGVTKGRSIEITSETIEEYQNMGHTMRYPLNKEEFDSLYWFKFNPKLISEYQKIFNEVNRSKTVTIITNRLFVSFIIS